MIKKSIDTIRSLLPYKEEFARKTLAVGSYLLVLF